MSKRKKLLINCPTCGSSLFVKRSSFKIAHHPLYVKRGQLIVNYSRNIYTEKRESKLWLKCINCAFSKEVKDENDLKCEISLLLPGKTELPKLPKQSKNQEVLPTIRKPPTNSPPKVEYDLETNTFCVEGCGLYPGGIDNIYD